MVSESFSNTEDLEEAWTSVKGAGLDTWRLRICPALTTEARLHYAGKFENGSFTLKMLQMFSVHIVLKEFENGGFTLETRQIFSVHTMAEKFENGGFALKTRQMFSVHTTAEKFESATITGQFGFVVVENLGRESTILS